MRGCARGCGPARARAVHLRPVPQARRQRARGAVGRRLPRVARRRARARRDPGHAARHGRPVRQPARARRRRAGGDGDGQPVRDLDRGLARRHLPGRAAVDPARRHSPYVPRLRGRARTRRRAGTRRPLLRRAARSRRAAADSAGGDRRRRQGRTRDRLGRDALPVRPGRPVPRRGAVAAAQRGCRRPLRVPAVELSHRRLLGRLPRAAARHRPDPAAGGDPRRRGGNRRPGLRALLPGHSGRRRRARRRADHARPPLLRPARPEPPPLHRRRTPLARRLAQPLRRDLPRRLPAALHPLLPDHARVLRLDTPSPAARGAGHRQRRPRARRRRPREGHLGDPRRRVPVRPARSGERQQLARARRHEPLDPGDRLGRGNAARRSTPAGRPPRRPGRSRRCGAGAYSPTISPRSNG